MKQLYFCGPFRCGFTTDGVGQFLFQVETDLGGDGEGYGEKMRGVARLY